MSISAPYRFVPLSNLVVFPSWAKQVSHDTPFEDGICGELTVTLTTITRLSVGGEQIPAQGNTPTQVKFYRTPQNTLAIPSSSLKGMLRNVLEIATFSRFKQVEDQKLGVRDISDANNFYAKAIVATPVKTGWMKFEDGIWKIYPCKFARLHQEDLIRKLGVPEHDWTRLKTASQRYDQIGICPHMNFNANGSNRAKHTLAKPNDNGILKGRVVVTGQPGRDFTYDRAKKWEFIFYDQQQEALSIPTEVMAGFNRIHADSMEWDFWKKKLSLDKQVKDHGVPVFFHQKDNIVKSLGLAMMYKLPYTHSIHDAINHTSGSHLAKNQPDLADLIFGHLEADESDGLRGRVNISMATLVGVATPEMTKATVLSSPKPTYYPLYMRQDGKNFSFRQLMEPHAELAGWKRYQVKAEDILPPPDKSKASVQVQLEVVPKNSRFTFKVRLHNIRPVELGALLWSINFGDNTNARHSLGTGKPYGLGQVKLEVTHRQLRCNNQQQIIDQRAFLNDCQASFKSFMEQYFKSCKADQTWEDSDPINALIKYATPISEQNLFRYITNPQEFMKLRHSSKLELFKKIHHFKPVDAQNHDDIIINNLEIVQSLGNKQTSPSPPATATPNAKNDNTNTLSQPNTLLKEKITSVLKKNTNPQLSNAFYLLEQLPKNGIFNDVEKRLVAQHIKSLMKEDDIWRETSSADKKERKKYEKTQEVKRFL